MPSSADHTLICGPREAARQGIAGLLDRARGAGREQVPGWVRARIVAVTRGSGTRPAVADSGGDREWPVRPNRGGSPQGGVISPLLLNVALHGMEAAAGVRYHLTGTRAGKTMSGCPAVIRYADDLIALCHSRDQAEQVKVRLAEWLAPRGLVFNEDGTHPEHRRTTTRWCAVEPAPSGTRPDTRREVVRLWLSIGCPGTRLPRSGPRRESRPPLLAHRTRYPPPHLKRHRAHTNNMEGQRKSRCPSMSTTR
jgi:hypothetical protein